jgi:hypothetical protein
VIEDLVWDGYQQRIAEMAKGGGIAQSLLAEAKSLQQDNEIHSSTVASAPTLATGSCDDAARSASRAISRPQRR